MGIVEQFSLEGLEVVMPARRCQLTVITTAPASRLRSATGAVVPFLTLSMYRPQLSRRYVRFRRGRECRIVAEQAYEQITTNT